MTAGGCKECRQERKAPSITHEGQPRATGWRNSFSSETMPPSSPQTRRLPATQRRFLPPCHMRQSPSVPVVSTTFPKQKPSQLAEPLGQLPLLRAWGKQRKHQLPAPLRPPDVTGGIRPAPVPPGCSFGESHRRMKVHTRARRSCTLKPTRNGAASPQHCLKTRRGEE